MSNTSDDGSSGYHDAIRRARGGHDISVGVEESLFDTWYLSKVYWRRYEDSKSLTIRS